MIWEKGNAKIKDPPKKYRKNQLLWRREKSKSCGVTKEVRERDQLKGQQLEKKKTTSLREEE